MHGGEQRLLFLEPEEVDFVDVEHALVGTVDGARLDTLVRGRLHATRLEGVVTDVTEQGA